MIYKLIKILSVALLLGGCSHQQTDSTPNNRTCSNLRVVGVRTTRYCFAYTSPTRLENNVALYCSTTNEDCLDLERVIDDYMDYRVINSCNPYHLVPGPGPGALRLNICDGRRQ